MMETKTLNQWLRHFGLTWVEGKEQIHKNEISKFEAESMIQQLTFEGAVKHGR